MNNTKIQALKEEIAQGGDGINGYTAQFLVNAVDKYEGNTLTEIYLQDLKAKLSQAQEDKIEFDNLIEKFSKLRLYRSKSCQLLLRRLKEELI